MNKESLILGENVELKLQLTGGSYSSYTYTSKVQDIINSNEFLISPPTTEYEKWLMRDVSIAFMRESGFYSAPAKITNVVKDNEIFLLHIIVLDKFARFQRRKFYRLKIDLDIMINDTIKAKTIDISGNGMLIESKNEFKVDDKIKGNIDLESNIIPFKAIVVRCDDSKHKGFFEIRLSFDDLKKKTQDTIVKFIHSKQIELLKKQSTSLAEK